LEGQTKQQQLSDTDLIAKMVKKHLKSKSTEELPGHQPSGRPLIHNKFLLAICVSLVLYSSYLTRNVLNVKTFASPEIAMPNGGGCNCTSDRANQDGGSSVAVERARTPSQQLSQKPIEMYRPSNLELYLLDHASELGWDVADKTVSGCKVWLDPAVTTPEIHASLIQYKHELESMYYPAVHAFNPIPDLMKTIRNSDVENRYDVCKTARVHPDGIKALFPQTSDSVLSSTHMGLAEPLTTPMRHPRYCFRRQGNLLNLDYFVHDFEAMCHQLKPTSRLVLFDLGASLTRENNPTATLMKLYRKFGFKFDHIYAFEMTFTQPGLVYGEQLEQEYFSSYHWINTGKCLNFVLFVFSPCHVQRLIKQIMSLPMLFAPSLHTLANNSRRSYQGVETKSSLLHSQRI